MKHYLNLFLIAIFTSCTLLLSGQEKCKVLKPEIAGTYDGKCKKGLAHGKGIATGTDRYEGQFSQGLPHGEGTYIWATGERYTGNWAEGMRHGSGEYTSVVNGAEHVQEGIWQLDKYFGPRPPQPIVLYNSGVGRYNFQKNNTTKSRVMIDIFQNGGRNMGISNFLMSTTSGTETKISQSIGYDYIIFPVTIKISYTTLNKLHTMPVNVKFDFEISEPGDWTVELNN